MNRFNLVRIAAVVLTATALAPIAALRAADEKAAASSNAAPTVLCVVMNNHSLTPSEAAGKAEYKGKTYYFCCGGCVAKFNKADDAGKARFAKLTDLRTEKIALEARLKSIDSELTTLEGKTAPAPAAAAVKAEKSAPLHCAITGEDIASAEAAAGKAEYNGKTYYFCCGGCVAKFKADPAKFAAAADKRATESKH